MTDTREWVGKAPESHPMHRCLLARSVLARTPCNSPRTRQESASSQTLFRLGRRKWVGSLEDRTRFPHDADAPIEPVRTSHRPLVCRLHMLLMESVPGVKSTCHEVPLSFGVAVSAP
jgi:hypothetical protein